MPWLTPDSSWEAVAEDMAVDSEAAAMAVVDLEAIPVDTVAGMEEDTEVGTEVVRLSRSSR